MSRDQGSLDSAIHDEILKKKILSAPEFVNATQQSRPKAIVLAGQPGAGKGGLADAAKNELRKDVVTIDPDELRDAHPRVNEFRNAKPYTWADDTHTDASQWAKELRAAAVDGKKNIIIDTTLGNGNSAVDMIKELQAKGYEVEVRAVVAHEQHAMA
jgi:predicted ABC-type ATPase